MVLKFLSKITGILAETRFPRPALMAFVKAYSGFYKMKLKDFEIDDVECFQDFFSRELRPGVRPVQGDFVYPVDGTVYQSGQVREGELVQVKGSTYKLSRFLVSQELVKKYENAFYQAIYLSPGDYHHIHAPRSGNVTHVSRVSGTLWSVGGICLRLIPELYCRQERLLIEISDDTLLVCVGAFNVGSLVSHVKEGSETTIGDKIASFMLGSTVVMLSRREIKGENKIKFGQFAG